MGGNCYQLGGASPDRSGVKLYFYPFRVLSEVLRDLVLHTSVQGFVRMSNCFYVSLSDLSTYP